MLKINIKNKTFELPLLIGSSSKLIEFEDDAFNIELIFSVPTSMISNLFNETNIIQTDENPIVILNLEINYWDYDCNTEKMFSIGNLKLNPSFKDLENLKLSDHIVNSSTLYFPGYAQSAEIKNIHFGKIINNKIDVEFSGVCIDTNGELRFEVTETLQCNSSVFISKTP